MHAPSTKNPPDSPDSAVDPEDLEDGPMSPEKPIDSPTPAVDPDNLVDGPMSPEKPADSPTPMVDTERLEESPMSPEKPADSPTPMVDTERLEGGPMSPEKPVDSPVPAVDPVNSEDGPMSPEPEESADSPAPAVDPEYLEKMSNDDLVIGPMSPEKPVDSPTPAVDMEDLDGPMSPEKPADSPTPAVAPEDLEDGPMSPEPEKPADSPTPAIDPEDLVDGPMSPEEKPADSPTPAVDPEDLKIGLMSPEKPADSPTRAVVPEDLEDGQMSPEKPADSPTPAVDPEDLEDGEIEDDEDEEGAVPEAPKKEVEEVSRRGEKKVSPFSKIFGEKEKDKENRKKEKNDEKVEKEKEKKSSRKDKESSHSHKDKDSKSKDKEKESKDKDRKDKDKEKDKDKKKKRRHSEESDAKNKTPNREKRSRKSIDDEGGPMDEDDESFMFVRGGSPPRDPMPMHNNFPYPPNEPDGYGRMYVASDSDDDNRRRRPRSRSRSPIRRRRMDRDDDRKRGMGMNRNRDDLNKGPKSDMICAYYMQGKCQKSHEDCAFSHNAVPPRKMELCKFWMMDCCAKREKCLYLHNDFPCKFYHTGLVCKQGEKCKFSHKPLNDSTKQVLLKHIETAPKEILGDFPRLNRNGALNLINKMEARILGALADEERRKGKERDQEQPRRTRWEQPTRDDQEKLQELMEEAGIGGFYRETLECKAPEPTPAPGPPMLQPPPLLAGIQFLQPPPSIPPPIIPQPTPVLVHNPALANVLANLNIPSTTIQPIQTTAASMAPTEEIKTVPTPKISPPGVVIPGAGPVAETKDIPYWDSESGNAPVASIAPAPSKDGTSILSDPPENLPPLQKELFLRIQQQQLKNENKAAKAESEDDEPMDNDWYSSDEDEGEKKDSSKENRPQNQNKSNQQQQQQQQSTGIDIASVISSIRKTVESPINKKLRSPSPPEPTQAPGRGDIDLRTTSTGNSGQSLGPFGDTDFRMSMPTMRPDLRDIDLRMTSSPTSALTSSSESRYSGTNPLAFLKLPSGPATEIDASINSHPPVQYKVRIVIGAEEPPNYAYIRHTLTPSQILMDPRLGPRPGSGTLSLIPDPASPPPSLHSAHHTPATIPAGDNLIDPRVRRAAASHSISQQPSTMQQQMPQQMTQQTQQMPLPQSAMPGLLGDPRFPRDPRSLQLGPPPGWPPAVNSVDEFSQQQAALAAQFMNAQHLGIPPLFPFPNPTGFPFMPPDFGTMQQNQGPNHGMGHLNQGGSGRPPFQNNQERNQNPRRTRPSSSWERYTQQQSDPDGNNQS